jgi:hypothetical protein
MTTTSTPLADQFVREMRYGGKTRHAWRRPRPKGSDRIGSALGAQAADGQTFADHVDVVELWDGEYLASRPVHRFLSLEEAERLIGAWRRHEHTQLEVFSVTFDDGSGVTAGGETLDERLAIEKASAERRRADMRSLPIAILLTGAICAGVILLLIACAWLWMKAGDAMFGTQD